MMAQITGDEDHSREKDKMDAVLLHVNVTLLKR